MVQASTGFQRQRALGTPLRVGGLTVTPESQALVFRWPRGAWVWTRPTAIRVERDDGTTERLPIVDVTRISQWVLGGLAALFAIVSVALTVRNLVKNHSNGRIADE